MGLWAIFTSEIYATGGLTLWSIKDNDAIGRPDAFLHDRMRWPQIVCFVYYIDGFKLKRFKEATDDLHHMPITIAVRQEALRHKLFLHGAHRNGRGTSRVSPPASPLYSPTLVFHPSPSAERSFRCLTRNIDP